MRGKLSRRQILKMAALAPGFPAIVSDSDIRLAGFFAGRHARESAASTPGPALATTTPLGVSFVNVARSAGITHQTIFGGEDKNTYLLETTGCGIAFFDYDNDGWLDIFCVNGSRLGGFPAGQEPTNHLYKNNRDGTFTDVTAHAGLAHSGWGQGVCIGDYDNDGFEDLFVSAWGRNLLYHNNGDGTFADVSERAGVAGTRTRWGTGCAFVDYDRDGRLDLFVANYVDIGDLKAWPLPQSGPCLFKGVVVACGPPGLAGGKNILYHNNGDGTFTDVSDKAGITHANGTYGLGVLTGDFDNDGWPDIYVANDSQPSALYHNNHDGTFTDIGITAGCAYSQDGKPQAGMGATAGDYDCDGWLDIFKTNFSEDTCSLYRNTGNAVFDDVTFPAGLGLNTRYLSWGCGFFDLDNDGWADLFVASGHIYPEIKKLNLDIRYQEPKTVYRNLGNGRFQEVSKELGEAILEPISARGCAFGDFDNDGDVDIVVNPVNAVPQLLRCDSTLHHHWLKVRTLGVQSNRSGIGARVKCVTGQHQQIDEVRSGGSYASQNDLRVHFGLGPATKADRLEIRWPSGHVNTLLNVAADQVVYVEEGKGIVKGK
ncbi:MAG TPA: CRTAC1 family protein [Terriglobia bacterium]|nr:CRTAC1 family protein [Terriglobia bacterium]